MRIRADRDRCVGSGQCVLAAPTVFDQSEDGLVRLREHVVTPDDHDAVYQAEEICPSRAIRIMPR